MQYKLENKINILLKQNIILCVQLNKACCCLYRYLK